MSGRIQKQILRRCAPFWKLRERIVSLWRTPGACDDDSMLRASMQWLCRAQDAAGGGGVSTSYDLRQGWLPPFPETTGYIVPTFFNYARLSGESGYRDRALAMLKWLCRVQNPDGSIQAVIPGMEKPVIFDTGQVLFGFLRGFMETQDEAYLFRAEKCGSWLVEMQDSDGKWSRHEFMDHLHAYNTRVAWALTELARVTEKPAFAEAAGKNLAWAARQQLENGWFENNAFSPEQPTYTHTIAYVARGFLECGLLIDRPEWIQRAKFAADALMERQRPDGSLAGSYDSRWEPTALSTCLTGNAQMAFIWLRLFQITREETYRISARKTIDFLSLKRERSSCFVNIRGAVAGSWPIDGNYLPYVYPNWAAKFVCDLMMRYGTIDNEGSNLVYF